MLLGRDDHVVEFEITPNRPDCLCMIGLARETAVTFGKELKLHEPVVRALAGGNIADTARIVIEDGVLCPRYTARMVRNVKIGPSPEWMKERIRTDSRCTLLTSAASKTARSMFAAPGKGRASVPWMGPTGR